MAKATTRKSPVARKSAASPAAHKSPPTRKRKNSNNVDQETKEVVASPHPTLTSLSSFPSSLLSSSKNKQLDTNGTNSDSFDLVIPTSLGSSSTGECTVLVQIDPPENSSSQFDLHGAAGAIGRFEANENGIILDLKGSQYHGTLLPGPTAMVVSLNHNVTNNLQNFHRQKKKEQQQQELSLDNDNEQELEPENTEKKTVVARVEAVTDEFCRLVQTQSDVMKKLNAVVEGDFMDEDYQNILQEENVNLEKKNDDTTANTVDSSSKKGKPTTTESTVKGRKSGSSTSGAAKRRKNTKK